MEFILSPQTRQEMIRGLTRMFDLYYNLENTQLMRYVSQRPRPSEGLHLYQVDSFEGMMPTQRKLYIIRALFEEEWWPNEGCYDLPKQYVGLHHVFAYWTLQRIPPEEYVHITFIDGDIYIKPFSIEGLTPTEFGYMARSDGSLIKYCCY